MLEEDAERGDDARLREATVADVARLAGVSKATAARALGRYGSVNEETRLRVMQAAEAVGYLPNALAKMMSTGRSQTIGVVLSDIENPFFARATRGIADVARSRGLDVILCNTDEDAQNETSAIDMLLEKRVAGMIVAPVSREPTTALIRAREQGRPIVLFDRGVDDAQFDTVIADNLTGGRELTSVLVRAGHRRIAFISTLDQYGYERGDIVASTSVADRVQGFHEALDEGHVDGGDRLVLLDGRRRGIEALIQSALSEGATGLVASDSLIGQQVMHFVRERGLLIPGDISLVTFDNADWTSLATPPVTVMAQPINEMGAEAARILIDRLEGNEGPPQAVVMKQRLIERASVSRVREGIGRGLER